MKYKILLAVALIALGVHHWDYLERAKVKCSELGNSPAECAKL